jgi:hypothetical protein
MLKDIGNKGIPMLEEVSEEYFDPEKNQLPHGGATNILGKIVWVITEKEKEMIARIEKAFGG